MPDKNLIGTLIREWRQKKKWTQSRLAKEICVSRATVGYWECGAKEPTASHFVRVVNTLEIPWESICEGLEIDGAKFSSISLHARVQHLENILRRLGAMP